MIIDHRSFPIDSVLPQLCTALADSRQAILSAPPGTGKTVHVPLVLLDEPWLAEKKIIMFEPRRLATRRSAEFMAQRLGEMVGQTVGYRILGDAVVSSKTRLEVVTEGILTRMLHANPDLPEVGLIIFDEFHERNLHSDLGLALTLDVQKHLRTDLKLVIMYATLGSVRLGHFLNVAPVIEGRDIAFPVETRYARFTEDKPLESRVIDLVQRILLREAGDILVFLPGMREIRRVEEKLTLLADGNLLVCPLHGELPRQVQETALSPASSCKRKVILSTSIAETSLTIEGIRIVVDSGKSRSARFDPRKGMSALVTLPVSRAVADQRRGRAGRIGPGICYRLWTEAEHQQLPEYPTPEIRASDLASLALDLAQWHDPNGENLEFIDPPPPAHLAQAQDVLIRLSAITRNGELTDHGRDMAIMAVHPRLSHMILKAKEIGRTPVGNHSGSEQLLAKNLSGTPEATGCPLPQTSLAGKSVVCAADEKNG